MTPYIGRTFRAAVRAAGGAVRQDGGRLEFYRRERVTTGVKETASVLVGTWEAGTWTPAGGEPVPCPDSAAALDLFRPAAAAGEGTPKPLTHAAVNRYARTVTQSGVATGRAIPRNRGTKPYRGGE